MGRKSTKILGSRFRADATAEEHNASKIHDTIMGELLSNGLFLYLEEKAMADANQNSGLTGNTWNVEAFEDAIARL